MIVKGINGKFIGVVIVLLLSCGPLIVAQEKPTKKTRNVKMLLGVNLMGGLTFDKMNTERVQSAPDVKEVRSTSLDGSLFSGLGNIGINIGVEVYKVWDIYATGAWGVVNSDQRADYQTSGLYTDGKIHSAKDKFYFGFRYLAMGMATRYTLLFGKAKVHGLYFGLGFNALYVYDKKSVYQNASLEDSFIETKDRWGTSGSPAKHTDAAMLSPIQKGVFKWTVHGDIGYLYRMASIAKLYVGYQIQYHINSLYGDKRTFYVREKSSDATNKNSIIKMTLPAT